MGRKNDQENKLRHHWLGTFPPVPLDAGKTRVSRTQGPVGDKSFFCELFIWPQKCISIFIVSWLQKHVSTCRLEPVHISGP